MHGADHTESSVALKEFQDLSIVCFTARNLYFVVKIMYKCISKAKFFV